MSPDLLNKIDARGRHELLGGGLEAGAELMIRTAHPLSPREREYLAGAGFESHFAAGNIASGAVVGRKCLEAVASLPFVDRIEVSRPMFEEQHAG